MFIGLLNRSTMGDAVSELVESCAGELLTTTGSNGCQSDCAKIFAEVPGIEMSGVRRRRHREHFIRVEQIHDRCRAQRWWCDW